MHVIGIKRPMERVMAPRLREIVPFEVGELPLVCSKQSLSYQLEELGITISGYDWSVLTKCGPGLRERLKKVVRLSPTTPISDEEVPKFAKPKRWGPPPGVYTLLGAVRAQPELSQTIQLAVRDLGSSRGIPFVAIVHKRTLSIRPARGHVFPVDCNILHSIVAE